MKDDNDTLQTHNKYCTHNFTLHVNLPHLIRNQKDSFDCPGFFSSVVSTVGDAAPFGSKPLYRPAFILFVPRFLGYLPGKSRVRIWENSVKFWAYMTRQMTSVHERNLDFVACSLKSATVICRNGDMFILM